MRWRGVDTGSRHSHGDEQSCLSQTRLEWLGQGVLASNTLTSNRACIMSVHWKSQGLKPVLVTVAVLSLLTNKWGPVGYESFYVIHLTKKAL